jgi:hypothetical protein
MAADSFAIEDPVGNREDVPAALNHDAADAFLQRLKNIDSGELEGKFSQEGTRASQSFPACASESGRVT